LFDILEFEFRFSFEFRLFELPVFMFGGVMLVAFVGIAGTALVFVFVT